jgi:hypothetical protein
LPERKFTLRSKVVLSDKQLNAIGCVAVESAYLDDLFDRYIQGLSCLDEHDARVLTAGAQLSAKLQVLKALTKERIKSEFARKHENIFAELGRHITDRNNIVHGTWHVETLNLFRSADEKTSKWVPSGETWAKRKKRGEVGHTIFKPKDIMDTANGLCQSGLELVYFLKESGLWPPQFVRSSPPPPIHAQTLGSDTTTKAHPSAPKKGPE